MPATCPAPQHPSTAWQRTRARWSVCLAATALAACAVPGLPAPESESESGHHAALPTGFVHLAALAPDVLQDMRYHGADNFVGRPIAAYESPRCILSEPAARALQAAQAELRPQGMALKVFDCYRPQAAVDDFVRWGRDLADQKTKAAFYPDVPKQALFQRGYIAEKSGHSRGSTVDVTAVVLNAQRASQVIRGPLADGMDVDMGTPFDWFGVQSHTENPTLAPDVQHNRRWLRALLQRHGFRNLPEEWWHYTLQSEPYPERYFNFSVR
ncbi:MAG: M15 family metallopeptidase [Giesbergeria sp.]|nr:M15 family metallopeptidase [Giesbergeria sp.]